MEPARCRPALFLELRPDGVVVSNTQIKNLHQLRAWRFIQRPRRAALAPSESITHHNSKRKKIARLKRRNSQSETRTPAFASVRPSSSVTKPAIWLFTSTKRPEDSSQTLSTLTKLSRATPSTSSSWSTRLIGDEQVEFQSFPKKVKTVTARALLACSSLAVHTKKLPVTSSAGRCRLSYGLLFFQKVTEQSGTRFEELWPYSLAVTWLLVATALALLLLLKPPTYVNVSPGVAMHPTAHELFKSRDKTLGGYYAFQWGSMSRSLVHRELMAEDDADEKKSEGCFPGLSCSICTDYCEYAIVICGFLAVVLLLGGLGYYYFTMDDDDKGRQSFTESCGTSDSSDDSCSDVEPYTQRDVDRAFKQNMSKLKFLPSISQHLPTKRATVAGSRTTLVSPSQQFHKQAMANKKHAMSLSGRDHLPGAHKLIDMEVLKQRVEEKREVKKGAVARAKNVFAQRTKSPRRGAPSPKGNTSPKGGRFPKATGRTGRAALFGNKKSSPVKKTQKPRGKVRPTRR